MEQSTELTKTQPTEAHAKLLLMLFTRDGLEAIEDQMQQMEKRPESVVAFNSACQHISHVMADYQLSLQDAFLVCVQVLAGVTGQIAEAENESSEQG